MINKIETSLITQEYLQEFFTSIAFDNTITWKKLQEYSQNEKAIDLGEFMSYYSHNNSDYYDDELIERIKKSFPDLDPEQLMIFHNHCKSFCELFEGQEKKQFAKDVFCEIRFFANRFLLIID